MLAEWLASWWAWIVVTTLQASALLAAAWSFDRLARRRAWPQLLATVWQLALLRLAIPTDFASPWSVTSGLGGAAQGLAGGATSLALVATAFSMWLAGVAFVAFARIRTRRTLERAIERRIELSPEWRIALLRASSLARRRAPRVAVLDGLRGAAVTGPLRPTLLLPRETLRRAPTRADEHALLHELMHLRRGDLWLDEAAAIVRALFWFNPLVWQATARLHELNELSCDRDVASALGDRAKDYSATLLEAAREWVSPNGAASSPALGLHGFLGRRALILVRLEHLERAPLRSLARVRVLSAVVAAALAACVLPMAPSQSSLRQQALDVLAAERAGELQSCFALQAAALVLHSPDAASSPERR